MHLAGWPFAHRVLDVGWVYRKYRFIAITRAGGVTANTGKSAAPRDCVARGRPHLVARRPCVVGAAGVRGRSVLCRDSSATLSDRGALRPPPRAGAGANDTNHFLEFRGKRHFPYTTTNISLVSRDELTPRGYQVTLSPPRQSFASHTARTISDPRGRASANRDFSGRLAVIKRRHASRLSISAARTICHGGLPLERFVAATVCAALPLKSVTLLAQPRGLPLVRGARALSAAFARLLAAPRSCPAVDERTARQPLMRSRLRALCRGISPLERGAPSMSTATVITSSGARRPLNAQT